MVGQFAARQVVISPAFQDLVGQFARRQTATSAALQGVVGQFAARQVVISPAFQDLVGQFARQQTATSAASIIEELSHQLSKATAHEKGSSSSHSRRALMCTSLRPVPDPRG